MEMEEKDDFISVSKFLMMLPLEGSFLCGEIIGNENLRVETGSSVIQCNEDVEETHVSEDKFDVTSDAGLH